MPGVLAGANRGNMKTNHNRRKSREDEDTMRPEYDFSRGVRGKHAARYAEGTNVVVIDPEVRDVFPNAETVNRALRALAPVLRQQLRTGAKRRTA